MAKGKWRMNKELGKMEKGKWIRSKQKMSNTNLKPNYSFTGYSRLLYIKVIYQIMFPYNGLQESIRGI